VVSKSFSEAADDYVSDGIKSRAAPLANLPSRESKSAATGMCMSSEHFGRLAWQFRILPIQPGLLVRGRIEMMMRVDHLRLGGLTVRAVRREHARGTERGGVGEQLAPRQRRATHRG
jgi:hypothetical protein